MNERESLKQKINLVPNDIVQTFQDFQKQPSPIQPSTSRKKEVPYVSGWERPSQVTISKSFLSK